MAEKVLTVWGEAGVQLERVGTGAPTGSGVAASLSLTCSRRMSGVVAEAISEALS